MGAQFFRTQSFAMFCCLSLKVDLRDFLNAVSMASKHVIYTASVMDYIFVCLSLSNVCKANEEQCFIIFSISVFGLREMEAGREPGEGGGGGGGGGATKKQKTNWPANFFFSFFFAPPPPPRLPNLVSLAYARRDS